MLSMQAIGRGMNSEERYMRELQAAGVAMTLANIFNDRVAQVSAQRTRVRVPGMAAAGVGSQPATAVYGACAGQG